MPFESQTAFRDLQEVLVKIRINMAMSRPIEITRFVLIAVKLQKEP